MRSWRTGKSPMKAANGSHASFWLLFCSGDKRCSLCKRLRLKRMIPDGFQNSSSTWLWSSSSGLFRCSTGKFSSSSQHLRSRIRLYLAGRESGIHPIILTWRTCLVRPSTLRSSFQRSKSWRSFFRHWTVNWMRRKRCPEAARQHRLLANENANRLHLLKSTSARYSQIAWELPKVASQWKLMRILWHFPWLYLDYTCSCSGLRTRRDAVYHGISET